MPIRDAKAPARLLNVCRAAAADIIGRADFNLAVGAGGDMRQNCQLRGVMTLFYLSVVGGISSLRAETNPTTPLGKQLQSVTKNWYGHLPKAKIQQTRNQLIDVNHRNALNAFASVAGNTQIMVDRLLHFMQAAGYIDVVGNPATPIANWLQTEGATPGWDAAAVAAYNAPRPAAEHVNNPIARVHTNAEFRARVLAALPHYVPCLLNAAVPAGQDWGPRANRAIASFPRNNHVWLVVEQRNGRLNDGMNPYPPPANAPPGTPTLADMTAELYAIQTEFRCL